MNHTVLTLTETNKSYYFWMLIGKPEVIFFGRRIK